MDAYKHLSTASAKCFLQSSCSSRGGREMERPKWHYFLARVDYTLTCFAYVFQSQRRMVIAFRRRSSFASCCNRWCSGGGWRRRRRGWLMDVDVGCRYKSGRSRGGSSTTAMMMMVVMVSLWWRRRRNKLRMTSLRGSGYPRLAPLLLLLQLGRCRWTVCRSSTTRGFAGSFLFCR